jgi:hypothetical protein
MQWARTEQQYECSETPKTASEYIQQLEQGGLVEVQGYRWSSRLWHDSFHCDLPTDIRNGRMPHQTYKRPVKIVKLGEDAAPLVTSHFKYNEVRELSWLYSCNFDWVVEAVGLPTGGDNEGGH